MIVALTQVLILGLPLAMLLDRAPTRLRLTGLSFLLGSGAVSLILLALPRWSPVSVTAAVLAVSAALWVAAWRRRPVLGPFERPRFADYGTLVLAIAHARAATRTFFDEWDFWAIWGLKGRVFLEHRGIDWAWLEHPWNAFAHPDYPPLLSLNYAFYALGAGEWNEARLGLVTTLFGAAVVLIVRDSFDSRLAPWATLGMASLALSPWVGLAEAPLIAYGTAGLLFLRKGDLTLGALLLGFAACTKNEGLTLLVAAAGALVLSGRWRDVPRLWPAALAVAAPWQVLRALHALPTDLLAGPVQERVVANLSRASDFATALAAERPVQPELWIALLAGLVLLVRDLPRERFVLIAVALQLVFFLAAFAATPKDLAWHVETAAARLLEQLALPLAFAVLSVAGARMSPPDRDAAAPRV